MPASSLRHYLQSRQDAEWHRGLPLLALFSLLWLTQLVHPILRVDFSLTSFLPLHAVVEVASLTLSVMAFALYWWVPQSIRRTGTVVLAATLLGAAWMDMLHMLSYQGMPAMVTPSGPEKAIAFWLGGRGLMTLGLLGVAFAPANAQAPPHARLASLVLCAALVTGMTWVVLFQPASLPRTYLPGVGLTAAKVSSELLLVGLLALASVRLFWNAQRHRNRASSALAVAAAFGALGELCFSSYASVSDSLNVIGHLCKLVAYAYITRDAYLQAMRQPLEAVGGLAEALQATLSPSFICDEEGTVRWVNRAFEQATGYGGSDIVGRNLTIMAVSPEAAETCPTLEAVLRGDAWQGQSQVRRRDGSVSLDERSVAPMRNAQGHLTGYVVVCDDVTERQQRAAAVEESATRLRVLLQSAPDAVVVIDGAGAIQLANAQTEHMFGYGMAELLGANVKMLMPPEVGGQHDHYLSSYGKSGVRNIIGTGREVTARRKDGSSLHVHLTVGEARLPSGTVFIGFIRDITERIQAQRHLAEREARYRTLMDTAQDGVLILDVEGRIVAANQAYASRSGYPTEALARMRIQDLEARDNPQQALGRLQQIRAQGHDQFETQHRDQAGGLWPVEITVTFWSLGAGQFFMFVRDLTERKRAEHALRQSEERFGLALRGANDGLWDRDLLNDTIYFSPRWKEMLGYRDDELPNAVGVLAQLVHPADALRMHQTFKAATQGDSGDRFEVEMQMRHQQGHWVNVLSRGQLVRDQSGRPTRLIGTHQDLTERRRAEQTLRENEDKLRRLFELSPLGIALCTMGGQLVECNEAFSATVGYSQTQLRQLSYWDLTPAEYYAAEVDQLDLLNRTGRYGPFEKHYRHADGTLVPVRLNGVRLEVNGEQHIWSMTEDLTAQRKAEAERQTMQQQQMQSQKLEALGQLTGGVAHDFNNMLAGIMGLASLGLERHVPDPDSKLARYLREIVHTSERGRDLVAKMLAFARTDDAAPAEPHDIGPLVEEMRDMLSTSIPSGVALAVRIAEGLPPVRVSSVDIHQIVMNLVINARDAIGEHGRIEVRLRRVIAQREQCAGCVEMAHGPHVLMEVEDNGCGIADNVVQKIFDPFFTTKPVGKGTGLGLSSVLGIVHKAGGHMQIVSTPGQGTTMRVWLPVANDARTALKPGGDAPLASPSALNARVWVVDDDPAGLVFLNELLREQVRDVASFAHPQQVFEALESGQPAPDVLITDQTMPGMSGVELATHLKASHPGLGVILCTGYSEFVDAERAQRLGIHQFLKKPFHPGELTKALAGVLA